jgi:hypothetical protein
MTRNGKMITRKSKNNLRLMDKLKKIFTNDPHEIHYCLIISIVSDLMA